MKNNFDGSHRFLSEENSNFVKEHRIRMPRKYCFLTEEEYEAIMGDFSFTVNELRTLYYQYIAVVDRIEMLWEEYQLYMEFLGKKCEKVYIPKKKKLQTNMGLKRECTLLIYLTRELNSILVRIEEMKEVAKTEVLQKILEDALLKCKSEEDVIVLRSDYIIQYLENEKGFHEVIEEKAQGKSQVLTGIMCMFGYEHIAFIPKYTKTEEIMKKWRPEHPLSVRCIYVPHRN
ncbi:MAG: hypothetical protein Q4D02_02260 [Clostridia bacterium]|nr:hypothetical protein [Clostridia bacterium]